MAKASESTEQVRDEVPQSGGSYIRNADGTLSPNHADVQKQSTADEVAATETQEE